MKNLLSIIFSFILSVGILAQAPQMIDFQAVARDQDGAVISDTDIAVRISILKNTTTGPIAYQERHSVTTDLYGHFVLHLGGGEPLQHQFDNIDWSTGSHFVKLEMDINGGSSYKDLGTLELMSVPYALYAENVRNVNDADADPDNELQQLSLSGTQLTLSDGGGTVTLPSTGGGGDNWGVQYVETDATIDGKGTTSDPVKVARQGATSQQVLKWNGSTWLPKNDEVNDADADPDNELQSLSINGNKLSISDGNTVTLPDGSGFSGDWNDLSNVPAGFADDKDDVNDNDHDPENELQTLTLSLDGARLGLTHGNYVALYDGIIRRNPKGISINSIFAEGILTVEGEDEIGIHATSYVSDEPVIVGKNLSPSGLGGQFSCDFGVGLLAEGGDYGIKSYAIGFGVLGVSFGSKGRGVKGVGENTNSIGVWGSALNSNSTGVYGEGSNYDFYAAGPGENYGAASSIRWKNNIQPLSGALDKVLAMRGVYFDWDAEHGGQHDMGMIAEEVGKILPEIVLYEENGVDASGMDYSKLTPVLLEAIKAQQKMIEDLERRIERLEGDGI